MYIKTDRAHELIQIGHKSVSLPSMTTMSGTSNKRIGTHLTTELPRPMEFSASTTLGNHSRLMLLCLKYMIMTSICENTVAYFVVHPTRVQEVMGSKLAVGVVLCP